jgi:hypothetical protein
MDEAVPQELKACGAGAGTLANGGDFKLWQLDSIRMRSASTHLAIKTPTSAPEARDRTDKQCTGLSCFVACCSCGR